MPSSATPLAFENFVIDPREHELRVDGRPVKIGARAFDLLMVLVERNGHLVGKDELLELVWPRMVVEENTLQVQISALRRLLGPKVIVTVPGRGYRFTAIAKNPMPPATDALSPLSGTRAASGHTAAVPASRTPWRLAALGVLAAAFVGGAWFLGKYTDRVIVKDAPAPVPGLENSIAVLPFVDMSEKKDQEYFADGLAEELLDLLSRVPKLHVVARTSAFSFKGSPDGISAIGAKLHVANVLEGSVRKSGNSLRISVTLVRADNGFHVWSQTYTRRLDDIFKIQEEIATSVAQALEESLVEGAMPKGTGTRSMAAHELYLRARFLRLHAATVAEWKRVTGLLEKALELDPNYASAWTTLAGVRAGNAAEATAPSQKEWSEAFYAAQRALDLDPKLPDAHSALAKVLIQRDWDWEAGQAQLRQALDLDPGNSWALAWSGDLFLMRGQTQKAVELLQRAVASDPENSYRYDELSTALLAAGRFDEALTAARRSQDMNRRRPGTHFAVGRVFLVRGDTRSALEEFNREDFKGIRLFGLALAYYSLGRKTDSDTALAALRNTLSDQAAFNIAEIHAFRKEFDQAFAWLDRAFRQHDERCMYVKSDPLLGALHADPRFKTYLRRMNLPQ